jgi:hypothetical protein
MEEDLILFLWAAVVLLIHTVPESLALFLRVVLVILILLDGILLIGESFVEEENAYHLGYHPVRNGYSQEAFGLNQAQLGDLAIPLTLTAIALLLVLSPRV